MSQGPLVTWPARFARWMVAVTSTTEAPTAVALTRIGLGLSLVVLLAPLLFTAEGRDVLVFSFCDKGDGGYRAINGSGAIHVFGGPVPDVVFGLLGVALVGAVFMVVGVFGRVSVALAVVGTRVVFGQNPDTTGAGDALLANGLFLLLLCDCTATLSLDCKLRTGRFVDDTPLPAWARRLGVVQLALMYTTTGLQKLVSTAWTPLDGFSALFQILQSPHWARFPDLMTGPGHAMAVPMALMTAVTIVWECSFFVVLWKPRLRLAYAVVGVAVHIGIYFLMEVGVFSVVSIALYPLLFSPEVVAGLGARVRRCAGRRTAAAAGAEQEQEPKQEPEHKAS